MALWDLLGKARGEPVWRLLGYPASHPKTPYASLLFGDSAQETLARGQDALRRGFKAAKFGWGPIGRGTPAQDADHFFAAREALGPDGILLVDSGGRVRSWNPAMLRVSALPVDGPRLGAVLFRNDDFDPLPSARIERWEARMQQRQAPSMILSPANGPADHGAAAQLGFTQAWGLCLLRFVHDPAPPTGTLREGCPAAR
jgi:PAS domain-containing protein